jgi:hypothetical protein
MNDEGYAFLSLAAVAEIIAPVEQGPQHLLVDRLPYNGSFECFRLLCSEVFGSDIPLTRSPDFRDSETCLYGASSEVLGHAILQQLE